MSATGFKNYIQAGLTLQVGNTVQTNVAMQLGSVSESVEVVANTEMVQTKDNSISQVIDQKRIVDLLLNGRNPTQLITLTGAVTTAPGGDLTGSKNIQGSNGSGTFSVAGGQANGTNYLLDGGDNNDAFSNVNLPLPFPDALQEFSVQTNAQGTRQRSSPPSQISYIPNQAVLSTGDFTSYTTPAVQGGCLSSATKQVLKDRNGNPFPNNTVPVSQFDPAALLIATKYLPATTDPCGGAQYGVPANNPDDQWIGRVDYIRSDKHSIYGRYYLYDFTAPPTFDGTNLLTTTAAGNQDRSQTATFGDTYSFSATMLNSFHATFDRRRDNRGGTANMISPDTLGDSYHQLVPDFLQVSIPSYFNVGCGTCASGHFNVNDYQVSDDFTIIRGKHQFGFGVDGRRGGYFPARRNLSEHSSQSKSDIHDAVESQLSAADQPGLVTVNHLGNATRHIWGARVINPALFIPGNCGVSKGKPVSCSSTGNTNQRHLLNQLNPAQGRYYSSIVLAHTFTLLSNYT